MNGLVPRNHGILNAGTIKSHILLSSSNELLIIAKIIKIAKIAVHTHP
jgi:hypothetical protein